MRYHFSYPLISFKFIDSSRNPNDMIRFTHDRKMNNREEEYGWIILKRVPALPMRNFSIRA